MTNFERIKEMNAEEMAKFLATANGENADFPCELCKVIGEFCGAKCEAAIEKWLSEPAEAWLS